jgi:hypothetical protein
VVTDEDCRSVDLSELMVACNAMVEATLSAEDLGQPLCPSPWLDYVGEVGRRLDVMQGAMNDVTRQLGLGGAKARLGRYLQQHEGQEVSAAALEAVAGIREWPRRIRELRDEGWPIEQRGSGSRYILVNEAD